MSRPSPEDFLAKLAQIRDATHQRVFISQSELAPTLPLIEALSEKIRQTCWKDPALAEALVETNIHLASQVGTSAAHAYATRSQAQLLYTTRRSMEAQPHFEHAAELFLEAGMDAEAGRTLVTEMDNLSYLSRYEDASRLEHRARAALEKAGDKSYLTRLEIALGNLYYRLNRYSESLSHYEAAAATSDEPVSTAAIGMGRAHVLTDMNRFDEALEAYEATQEYCEKHGLSLWVDIAEHGMSRMHMRRGNYSTALRMLEHIRRKHELAHDFRRVGLVDIDRAETYLQLNLFEDASTIAGRAFTTFERIGDRYQGAMCLTYQGIAEFKLLRDKEAEKAFLDARERFVLEGNETWVAIVDLWRAQLLIRQHHFSLAAQLAQHAAEVFDKQKVPVRAANARVLSAQSLQELDDTESAIANAQQALRELEGYHAPWVSYQAYNTLGHLKELEGNTEEAEQLFLRAVTELESLHRNIQLDELRMSFGKDKYQVYENIVNLKLKRGDLRSAFEFVERSKSRTLIDLLERNLDTVWQAGTQESPRLSRIRKIREELNLLYNRLNEVGTTVGVQASDTMTKSEIGRREKELLELLLEAGSEKTGWERLQSMELPTADDVQRMLEEDEVLVEYYSIGDQIQAFVISRYDLRAVRNLATISGIRTSLKGLNFQLSKFHLESDYVHKHADELLASTHHHLLELHRQLIQPIEHLIMNRPKLLVLPHQVLHYVPFHALFDGARYLVDTHDITYSASASILKICRDRQPKPAGHDLILAAADERTPYIHEEVEALTRLLPNALVFTGDDAREDKLRQYASTSGKIHIAAHGIFRADNPMFSSLKLGDSWLNLFDIFTLQLGAELTTLSACETGMSAVCEGDELLGLARGFLYAGTPSLVVSLWTVNDRSTAMLMQRFYEGLGEGKTKAHALREAMLAVKLQFPHPYYWAPFVLLGKS